FFHFLPPPYLFHYLPLFFIHTDACSPSRMCTLRYDHGVIGVRRRAHRHTHTHTHTHTQRAACSTLHCSQMSSTLTNHISLLMQTHTHTHMCTLSFSCSTQPTLSLSHPQRHT